MIVASQHRLTACLAVYGGVIEAGFPSPAEEELSDTLTLDEYLIENRKPPTLCALKGTP